MLSFLKPSGEKWVFSILFLVFFWLTSILTGYLSDRVHQRFYPHLNQTLPPTISFNKQTTQLFIEHERRLEKTHRRMLLVKIPLSMILSYLIGCLVVYLCEEDEEEEVADQDTATEE